MQMQSSQSTHVPLPWHDIARTMVRRHRLTYFAGSPGTGKSFFARRLAEELTDREPVVVYGSPVTDITEVFGRWILAADESRFIDGALPTALKTRSVLIIEEFSLIPLEVRLPLLALRTGETHIANPMNGETLAIPAELRLICVSNKESLACRRNGEALRALLSDFMILDVPLLADVIVRQFLAFHFPQAQAERLDRVVELWNQFRVVEGREGGDDKIELTYRAASHLLTLLEAGLDEHQAVAVALVNQFVVDPDAHSAQQLKHSISD